VSTADQDLTPQIEALQRAGCERQFSDKASGARVNRPGLAEAIDYARPGDVIVVWKLDRLGVNRRANGTPYRRAKGTPCQDGGALM
jgi:DNA invertase Pin-like site-specific DNA recombinase